MDFQIFQNKICKINNYSQEDIALLKKAFEFGKKYYSGLKRKNNEPYLNHCLRTALNLAHLKLSSDIVAAGILHDVLEDTPAPPELVLNEFGESIFSLIKAVTKIGNLKYRNKDKVQAENLRNLIVSIINDVRVALIKLADRLDNMRTLQYLEEEKRRRIALETADVYVPLALRLGISEWAGELDDLSLKFLDPEVYFWIAEEIRKKQLDNLKYLEKIACEVKKELENKNINLSKIEFRTKRISSIYKKLKRKDFDLNKIYDFLAFRIIVKKVEDCYLSLGIIHSLFKPIIDEFNDYIAFPKPNGYQSLHTTVITEDGKPIEFQIRTEEMHLRNEIGIAAYFSYAEAKNTKSYQKNKPIFADQEKVNFIKNLKNWKDNIFEVIHEKIYVLTPKGEVIELPNGSTPLDFAYKIHTEIGNHFLSAKVNQKIVPIDYKLQNGDMIEINFSKKSTPSIKWLSIVKSPSAKKKIKAFLRKKEVSPHTSSNFSFKIKITAYDKIGLLNQISGVITKANLNILESKVKTKKNIATLTFTLQTRNKKIVENLKERLKNQIKEIIKIE
jgi:GTP pyrophosphokinase